MTADEGADFPCDCILMDVEGTTAPVSYVYDVLFPYAARTLPAYLEAHWHEAAVQNAVSLMFPAGLEAADRAISLGKVVSEIERLMAADVKSTGLKELQGFVWAEGYGRGELKSEVFDDVPGALERWRRAGVDMRIYSSGSVGAQKVFFTNTAHGDLTPFLSAYYDTTSGPKREAASYGRIAAEAGFRPDKILFLSDVTAELDAAAAAGMMVALVVRPGNAPTEAHDYVVVNNFDQLDVVWDWKLFRPGNIALGQ